MKKQGRKGTLSLCLVNIASAPFAIELSSIQFI